MHLFSLTESLERARRQWEGLGVVRSIGKHFSANLAASLQGKRKEENEP